MPLPIFKPGSSQVRHTRSTTSVRSISESLCSSGEALSTVQYVCRSNSEDSVIYKCGDSVLCLLYGEPFPADGGAAWKWGDNMLCLAGGDRFPADGGATWKWGDSVLCLAGGERFPADGGATCRKPEPEKFKGWPRSHQAPVSTYRRQLIFTVFGTRNFSRCLHRRTSI